MGIQCKDLSGYAEFVIMDKNFRNYVRFKDFCKFVKTHKKGKAYKTYMDSDCGDSSMSSSEVFGIMMRDLWVKCDPQRTCSVPVRQVQQFVAEEITKCKFEDVEMLMKDMDYNKDGNITFEEFNKFFGKLMNI